MQRPISSQDIDEDTHKRLVDLICLVIETREEILKNSNTIMRTLHRSIDNTRMITAIAKELAPKAINSVKILFLFKNIYTSQTYNPYFSIALTKYFGTNYQTAIHLIFDKKLMEEYVITPSTNLLSIINHVLSQLPYSKSKLESISKVMHQFSLTHYDSSTIVIRLFVPCINFSALKAILLAGIESYLKREFAKTNWIFPHRSGPTGERRAKRLKFLVSGFNPEDPEDQKKLIACAKFIEASRKCNLTDEFINAFKNDISFASALNKVFVNSHTIIAPKLRSYYETCGYGRDRAEDKAAVDTLWNAINNCYYDLCDEEVDHYFSTCKAYVNATKDAGLAKIINDKTTFFSLLPTDVKTLVCRTVIVDIENVPDNPKAPQSKGVSGP